MSKLPIVDIVPVAPDPDNGADGSGGADRFLLKAGDSDRHFVHFSYTKAQAFQVIGDVGFSSAVGNVVTTAPTGTAGALFQSHGTAVPDTNKFLTGWPYGFDFDPDFVNGEFVGGYPGGYKYRVFSRDGVSLTVSEDKIIDFSDLGITSDEVFVQFVALTATRVIGVSFGDVRRWITMDFDASTDTLTPVATGTTTAFPRSGLQSWATLATTDRIDESRFIIQMTFPSQRVVGSASPDGQTVSFGTEFTELPDTADLELGFGNWQVLDLRNQRVWAHGYVAGQPRLMVPYDIVGVEFVRNQADALVFDQNINEQYWDTWASDCGRYFLAETYGSYGADRSTSTIVQQHNSPFGDDWIDTTGNYRRGVGGNNYAHQSLPYNNMLFTTARKLSTSSWYVALVGYPGDCQGCPPLATATAAAGGVRTHVMDAVRTLRAAAASTSSATDRPKCANCDPATGASALARLVSRVRR